MVLSKLREVCDKALIKDRVFILGIIIWKNWRWMNDYVLNNIMVYCRQLYLCFTGLLTLLTSLKPAREERLIDWQQLP